MSLVSQAPLVISIGCLASWDTGSGDFAHHGLGRTTLCAGSATTHHLYGPPCAGGSIQHPYGESDQTKAKEPEANGLAGGCKVL